jgi:hypothetical protein
MSALDVGRPMPRPLAGATVLQIIPSLADAPPARAAVDVAWALLCAGARAIVAGRDGPLSAELKAFGGEWIAFPEPTANPFRVAPERGGLAALISQERIGIVHAIGVGATAAAAEIAGTAGARLVTSYVGQVGSRDEGSYVRALARSDRIIAHSGYLADLLIERDQFPRERFVIVPPRIDTSWFDPAAISVDRVRMLRREWQVDRGERVVFVPGCIEPSMGQLTIVDAVRTLITGGMERVVFVLAGDERRHPGYARAVRCAVIAQGVETSFRFAGVCQDMPAAYAAADFVIIPAAMPPDSRAAPPRRWPWDAPWSLRRSDRCRSSSWRRPRCPTTAEPAGWSTRATPLRSPERWPSRPPSILHHCGFWARARAGSPRCCSRLNGSHPRFLRFTRRCLEPRPDALVPSRDWPQHETDLIQPHWPPNFKSTALASVDF